MQKKLNFNSKSTLKNRKIANYLSGSPRSKWKGPFSKIKTVLYKRILLLRLAHPRKNIRILKNTVSFDIERFCSNLRSRASIILNKHRTHLFKVYTGRRYGFTHVNTDHLGHRVGAFTFTTRRGSTIHRINAKSKKNKSLKRK